MKIKKIIFVALALIFSTLFFAKDYGTVDLDINRYLGTWYEIARFPLFWERGQVNTTANYSLMEDGRIKVINTGYYYKPDGKKSSFQGVAYAPNPEEPGKLLVSFFAFIESDYWVILLDEENYSYAAVSNPDKDYLWILSRTPLMDDDIYNMILDQLEEWNFDLTKLEKVLQEY